MMGAVIRMIETGGRKKPSTITIARMVTSSTHLESCIATIAAAADCEMWR
ncbi:hypothetical protein AEGHOMDF_3465 [Methylobacterium soli]|nr:hypothetical protein AEGHOMDF_3465 [Methylobacterium soli]